MSLLSCCLLFSLQMFPNLNACFDNGSKVTRVPSKNGVHDFQVNGCLNPLNKRAYHETVGGKGIRFNAQVIGKGGAESGWIVIRMFLRP